MAFTRLTRIRWNELASVATSSLPDTGTSGASKFPTEIASAIADSRRIGRITVNQSSELRNTRMKANTPPIDTSSARNAAFAIASGTAVGTLTTCAPTASLSFHPKPLLGP